MEDYDQFIDIESGILVESQPEHHVIDVNETTVETQIHPIYLWPLAFNYVMHCIRQMIQ